jgi:putative ABC transport system permease protein
MSAFRSWLRTPRLAFTLLACIAISIGGTATVLTFVHAILLRPLPFPHAERLVTVVPTDLGADVRPHLASRTYLSYPNFADLRPAVTSFELFEAATVSRLVMQTANGSERLRGETITPGYFDLLGVRPALGRTFTSEEYAGTATRAIIISDRLWRTRFGSDPTLVGRAVSTRVGPAVLVGIMPENYLGIGESEGTDYWLAEKQNNIPMQMTDRASLSTLTVARLKPGITRAQAESELQSLVHGLAAAHPAENAKLGLKLDPIGERWRGPMRAGLVTMLVGSGFLLLIGCGNVALLLLARLVDRERELALRLALGASRRRLIRMMLGESLLLAVVGGGLGILLAAWLVEIFVKTSGIELPTHMSVVLNAAPLALCVAVVLATGLLFGLLPAFAATRVNASMALRAGGRGVVAGTLRGRSGRLLVILQTALAVALLAGAALFLRSYEKLRLADFGFRTTSLLRYQVSPQRENYPTPEAIESFYRTLGSDFTTIPGVQRFGYMAPTLPPYESGENIVRLKGGDIGTPDGRLEINTRYTTSETLDLLDVPLRAGRLFAPQDRRGNPAVGLVSETLARRIAPDGSAIGRTLLLRDNTEVEIIGILADALWEGRRNRQPTRLELILSLEQFPQLSVGVVFATAVKPEALVDTVRKTIVARDGTAALHWITTMEEALDQQTVNERFWTVLATAYAGTAFLLAVIGLYGVLSHSVASRRQEMGVRLAVGATAAALARLVIGQGLRLVLAGVVAGLGVAFLLGRLLEARLYGVTARDPIALLASVFLLILVALLACWIPARRAARTDPMTALRAE